MIEVLQLIEWEETRSILSHGKHLCPWRVSKANNNQRQEKELLVLGVLFFEASGMIVGTHAA